jgi:hypothetical protein
MKIRIGDKLVEADASGIIKATAEEIPNANGGTDVVVHIPCLQIQAKKVEA